MSKLVVGARIASAGIASAAMTTAATRKGRRTIPPARRSQAETPASSPIGFGCRGQKSAGPNTTRNAGARVRPAARVTAIARAIAGPMVCTRPKRATARETRPTITVAADAAMTAPIRAMVRSAATAREAALRPPSGVRASSSR